MYGVIEFYCDGVFEMVAQRSEFRVLRERQNRTNEMRGPGASGEIAVALSAGRVTHSAKLNAALMLDVARRTGRRKFLVCLMDGPIVAREASLIRHAMSEGNRVRNVAYRTLLAKEGVRYG